jgi:hypothetical protein
VTTSKDRSTPADAWTRWGGALLVAAGAVRVAYPFLHPADDPSGYQSAAWIPVHLAAYLALVAVLVGFVALGVRTLAGRSRFHVAAFHAAFVGTALVLMEGHGHTFLLPILGVQQPGLFETAPPGLGLLVAGSLVFGVGYVLLGVAVARTPGLPHAAGLLLAVGAPLVAFAPPIGVRAVAVAGDLAYGLGLAWIGVWLWRSGPGAPRG